MYTSLEEAKSEIWRRWNDIKLKARVEEYLDGDIPPIFQKEPKAILVRSVVTPNFEFFNFTKASSSLNIAQAVAEYHSDKYCTVNPEKKYLGKISIYYGDHPFTTPQKARVKGYKILNFKADEGKAIKNLSTTWGQNFVEFHHQLAAKWLDNVSTQDISSWIAKHGVNPNTFYSRLLALFVCHGVQFENYHEEGHEAKFTRNIVRPAFQKVTDHFGMKPLIVPVVPLNSELDPAWSWYPFAMEADVQRNMIRHDTKTQLSL